MNTCNEISQNEYFNDRIHVIILLVCSTTINAFLVDPYSFWMERCTMIIIKELGKMKVNWEKRCEGEKVRDKWKAQ